MEDKPLEGKSAEDDDQGTGGDAPGEGAHPRGELEETRVVGGAAITAGESLEAGAYARRRHLREGSFDQGAAGSLDRAEAAHPAYEPHPGEESYGGIPETPAEEAEAAAGRRRLRLRAPDAWGRWVAVIVPAALHVNLAIQQAAAASGEVPAFQEIVGDLRGMLQAFISLFYKPETLGDTVRIYALWVFVILGLSIYAAVRSGDGLPIGVLGFIGYSLATVIILLVVVPGVWFLLGDKIPLAVELAAPAALLGITSLLAAGAGSPD